jgi:hypothetical protein
LESVIGEGETCLTSSISTRSSRTR